MPDEKKLSLPSRFDYSYHRQFNDNCSEFLSLPELEELFLDFKKIKIKGANGATDEILRMANIQKIIEFVQ